MAARFEASINRDLLRWGRARIKMPLEVAAKKIGVDSATLASWERGEARPSFSKLRTVAQVYQKPLSFFYLEEPPEELVIPADFRKVSRFAGSDDSEVMLAIFDALRRRIIIDEIYSESGWTPPSFEFFVSTKTAPREAASQLRHFLGVTVEQQFRTQSPYESLSLWRRALEERGVLVFQVGIPVEEMRGLSIHRIPFPLIVINAKDSPNARVFSLLHEVVHLGLRQSGICTFSEFGDEHLTEAFCDAVAAETLVPTDVFLKHIAGRSREDISQWPESEYAACAKKFGVSEHVIMRRLFEHGMIDERTYWERVRILSTRRYEPRSGGGSHYKNRVAQLGRPFIRTVLAAYETGALSARDTAFFLGTNVDGFGKLRQESM